MYFPFQSFTNYTVKNLTLPVKSNQFSAGIPVPVDFGATVCESCLCFKDLFYDSFIA